MCISYLFVYISKFQISYCLQTNDDSFCRLGYKNMTYGVTRLNQHSPIPTGTFSLDVNGVTVSGIPYSASAITLRDSVNEVGI